MTTSVSICYSRAQSLHQLFLIGEAAARISPNIKDRYPAIPWKVIYGFRNHVVHEYFSLDLDIVWQTVAADIPNLESQIRDIVKAEFP